MIINFYGKGYIDRSSDSASGGIAVKSFFCPFCRVNVVAEAGCTEKIHTGYQFCRANVVAEVHGNQRARFYYMVCPSCGARVCLDTG